jgi:transposase InsO family protein
VISQVKQEKAQMSIRKLCETLEVNRRWYSARLAQGETAGPDVELRDAIEQITLEFAGYGYRRVTHALMRAGWSVNHKRVLRIMREESLLCHLKRQFVPTTDSHHPFQVYPNLVKGLEVDAPDVVWVADITYIRPARATLSTWRPCSTPIHANASDGTCPSASIRNWRWELWKKPWRLAM